MDLGMCCLCRHIASQVGGHNTANPDCYNRVARHFQTATLQKQRLGMQRIDECIDGSTNIRYVMACQNAVDRRSYIKNSKSGFPVSGFKAKRFKFSRREPPIVAHSTKF
ncbi:MAG: hypothetical protein FWG79_09435 [Bacteroidales bacterium]|nr:hypothetical protein [Bacteroidales bacterium]